MKLGIFSSILSLSLLSTVVNADIVSMPGSKIKNIRVEGSYGLIGFDTSLSKPSGCGYRAWVDLRDEVGRVKYSTAMMAFASDNSVNVRVNSSSNKIFTECQLYDIVVSK